MSDRDNLESGSDQPPAKKAKSHYDTLSSHQTQQSSQGSQDIIIETGHHQGQLNTRHTINVIVNNNKRERQKRYREQNRDKLKQREAERRERIHFSQSIAGPSTSSKTKRIELNNEEIITAQSSSGLEEIQPSSIQSNDQGNEQNALQKKRERQQRYREQNRDKLKQREAERRRRLQNADVITELAASPNIEFTGIINDPIIDEISTNSQNIASLEEMQHGVVEVSQQIGRSQSSANSSEIPNNYSRFRYHKSAHEYFNDHFKNNEFGHACSICDRLWFEKDLKKPSASGSIINTITNGQNVDTLKVCSTCKSALDKNNIPNFSVYNGFHYPKIPQHLPKIDFITERLISPRIPFMQIRRLRHVQGQFGIYGQIINVPVSVDTMYLSQRSPAARPLPCEPIKVTSGPSLKYQAHPALGADFNPVITDIKSEADVIKQEEDPQSDDTLSLTEDADQQSDDDHQSDVDQPAEHLIPLSNVQIPLTNAPDPLSEVKVEEVEPGLDEVEEVEPGLDEVEDIKPVVVTSTVDRTRSVELTTPAELEEFRPVELSRTAEETSPGAYEEPTVPLPQYLRQELSRLGNNCYSLILKQADEINQLRVRCERQRRKLNGFVQLVRRRDNKISSLRAEIHELTTRTHLRGMQIRSFNTVVRQKKPNRQLLIVKREYKPPKSSVSVQHEPDTHTTTDGHKRASHLHTSHNDRNTSSGAKRTIDLQENSSDSIPDTSDVLRKSSFGVKCKSDTLQRSSSYIPGTSDVLQNPTVCTLDTQHKSLVRISDKSNVLKNRSFGVKCPLNSQEKSSVSIPGTSDGLQKSTVVKRTLDTQQNSTSGIPSTSNVRQTFSTDVKHDLDLKNNPSMVIQPLSVVPQTSVGFQRTSDVRPNKLVIQIDGMHNHVLQPKLVRLEDNSMETS